MDLFSLMFGDIPTGISHNYVIFDIHRNSFLLYFLSFFLFFFAYWSILDFYLYFRGIEILFLV